MSNEEALLSICGARFSCISNHGIGNSISEFLLPLRYNTQLKYSSAQRDRLAKEVQVGKLRVWGNNEPYFKKLFPNILIPTYGPTVSGASIEQVLTAALVACNGNKDYWKPEFLQEADVTKVEMQIKLWKKQNSNPVSGISVARALELVGEAGIRLRNLSRLDEGGWVANMLAPDQNGVIVATPWARAATPGQAIHKALELVLSCKDRSVWITDPPYHCGQLYREKCPPDLIAKQLEFYTYALKRREQDKAKNKRSWYNQEVLVTSPVRVKLVAKTPISRVPIAVKPTRVPLKIR